jgi:hypothetical protein
VRGYESLPPFGRARYLTSVRQGVAFAWLAVLASWVGTAHAGPFDDPYDLPDAPRPPVLPELTHPDLEATLESTVGALTPRAGVTAGVGCSGCATTRAAYVQTLRLEVPVGLRRWFVGALYDVAAGGGTGLNERFVPGNLELYGRTVWATSTGLAFGGGLGVILPTADYNVTSPAVLSVAQTAEALRPWDLPFFTDDIWALRPFVDVRDIVGRVTIQFREGLDIIVSSNDFAGRLTAMSALYLGYRAAPLLGLGLEAIELYTINGPTSFVPTSKGTGSIDDTLRATFVVSPSVRLMTPYFQPAISGFTSVGPPLYGAGDRIVGVRLSFTVVYDQTTRSIERGTPERGD